MSIESTSETLPPLKRVGRIRELDLLRGFFILVIIVDHLQRWPSAFQYLTGEGRLWVSAAEGFFAISGLLIGYIRAHKDHNKPMKDTARKLLTRAGMLYLWCVIITLIGTGLVLLLATPATAGLFPKLPDANMQTPLTFLWGVLTLNYANDWIYFLRLYAIMLALSPIVVWLLRKNLWQVVLIGTLGLYALSFIPGNIEGAFQWQLLFFLAALMGWKLDAVILYLRRHPVFKQWLVVLLSVFVVVTFVVSYYFVHGWDNVETGKAINSYSQYLYLRSWFDPMFSNNPLTVWRIVFSLCTFVGLFAIFHRLEHFLTKYLGWLLGAFGPYSLTVYCLQALMLPFFEFVMPLTDNFFVNTLYGLTAILAVRAALAVPFVKKILPQ